MRRRLAVLAMAIVVVLSLSVTAGAQEERFEQTVGAHRDAAVVYVGKTVANIIIEDTDYEAGINVGELSWKVVSGSAKIKDNGDNTLTVTPLKKGVIKVRITAAETGEFYSATKVIKITAKNPVKLKSKMVTLSPTKRTYTGKAQTVKVTVKNGKTKLKANKDYIVEYSDNVDAGKAKVKVTALSDKYKGSVTKTFTIAKASQSVAATLKKSTLWEGKTTTLSLASTKVGQNMGTITVTSGDKNKATVKKIAKGEYEVTAVKKGNVKITVTASGTDNYGKAEKVFKLTVDGPTELKSSMISLDKTSYTYDGSAKQPGVTVKDGKTVFKKGTDYTVSYTKNTAAGTALVKVKGCSKYCTGSASKTFTINKATQKFKVVVKAKNKEIVKDSETGEYNISIKNFSMLEKVGATIKVTEVDATPHVTTPQFSYESSNKDKVTVEVDTTDKTRSTAIVELVKKNPYLFTITIHAKGDDNHKAKDIELKFNVTK